MTYENDNCTAFYSLIKTQKSISLTMYGRLEGVTHNLQMIPGIAGLLCRFT